MREETGRTGRKTEELWRRRTVASCIPATNKGTVAGLAGARRRLLQDSRPDGELEGQRFWTRNSCSTMSRHKSKWKWVGRSREDPKLALQEQGGFNVAAASPPVFTRYKKTPYSNLTAEVEWWHGSSRVPCCKHRILMAVRQRPQARCSFINQGPLCSPLRHAGTQSHTVHIDFCLLLFFLFFFSPCLFLCLTSLPPLHSSSGELSLPSV